MIPFAPSAQLESSAGKVLQSRRDGKLLNLDKMLLHSPPYAAGWNALLANVRSNLIVSAKLTELVILGVAILNNAPYEFIQHIRPYESAGSSRIQREILKTLMDQQVQNFDMIINDVYCTEFDEVEKDVLQLTYMTTILTSKMSNKEKEALYSRLRVKLPIYPGTKRVGRGGSSNRNDRNENGNNSNSDMDGATKNDELGLGTELKVDSSLELLTAGSTDINSSILAVWEADDRVSIEVPRRGGAGGPVGGRKSMGVLEDAYLAALADFRNNNQNDGNENKSDDYTKNKADTHNHDKANDDSSVVNDDHSYVTINDEEVKLEAHASWQDRLHHLDDTGSISDSSISESDSNGGNDDGAIQKKNAPSQGDSPSNNSNKSNKSNTSNGNDDNDSGSGVGNNKSVSADANSDDRVTFRGTNDTGLNNSHSSDGSGSSASSEEGGGSRCVPTPEVSRMDDSHPDRWNEHSRRKNTTSQICFGDDNSLADPKLPELRKTLSKERNEQKNTQSHILFGDDLAMMDDEADDRDRRKGGISGGSERQPLPRSQLTSPQSTYSAISSPGDYDADLYVDLRKLGDMNEKPDTIDTTINANSTTSTDGGSGSSDTSKKGSKKKGLTLMEILEQKEAAEAAGNSDNVEQPKSRNRKSLTMMDLLDHPPLSPQAQAPNSNGKNDNMTGEKQKEKVVSSERHLYVDTTTVRTTSDNTTNTTELPLRSTSSPESMMFESGQVDRLPIDKPPFAAEGQTKIDFHMTADAKQGVEGETEGAIVGDFRGPMGGDMSPALSLKNVGIALTPAVVPTMRQNYNDDREMRMTSTRNKAERGDDGSIGYIEAVVELSQEELGNRCLVELIGVISTYNMVSRFLLACSIKPETQGLSALASPTSRGQMEGGRGVMEGRELRGASNIDKSVFVFDTM